MARTIQTGLKSVVSKEPRGTILYPGDYRRAEEYDRIAANTDTSADDMDEEDTMLAREDAVLKREAAARLRENAVAAREEAVAAREEAVAAREAAAPTTTTEYPRSNSNDSEDRAIARRRGGSSQVNHNSTFYVTELDNYPGVEFHHCANGWYKPGPEYTGLTVMRASGRGSTNNKVPKPARVTKKTKLAAAASRRKLPFRGHGRQMRRIEDEEVEDEEVEDEEIKQEVIDEDIKDEDVKQEELEEDDSNY